MLCQLPLDASVHARIPQKLSRSLFQMPDCSRYAKYACPRDYHPVCGTNGETYGNECVLCLANREDNTNIEILRRGHC
uniref:Kazal-like domain-containing protein n=1 Tax=Cyanistes caeruleus TaxID=156563 RepID=A0A8C0UU43_CYACU